MKKTLIRTLTFILGLYFILEFFLPEEIGGDFDKLKVRAPAIVPGSKAGEYSVYYVGEYNIRNQAVGLARKQGTSKLKKAHKGPVLRSTMMNSYDRLGFSSLSVVRNRDKHWMFYLGSDLNHHQTVCWATSSDGVNWEKHGRMVFTEAPGWQQYYENARSSGQADYGKVNAITAFVNGGEIELFVAYKTVEMKTEIRTARFDRNKTKLALTPKPLPLESELQSGAITSLSVLPGESYPEIWMLLSGGEIYRKSMAPDSKAVRVYLPKPISEEKVRALDLMARIAGMGIIDSPIDAERAFLPPTVSMFAETEKVLDLAVARHESGPLLLLSTEEGIFAAEYDRGKTWAVMPLKSKPVIAKGTPFISTYLSRGTEFAGKSLGIIGSFAIGLGVINMFLLHGKNLLKTRKEPHNSLVFFVCFALMFALTFAGKPIFEKISARKATDLKVKEVYENRDIEREIKKEMAEQYPVRSKTAQAYDFVFYFFLQALGTSVFALISFYMVGSAFRSFRIKSFEALLLIVAAIIVLLGQIPVGIMINNYLQIDIPWLSGKLLSVFNAAAYRGVILGMTIGALSMSLRLWLGLERGMFHGT